MFLRRMRLVDFLCRLLAGIRTLAFVGSYCWLSFGRRVTRGESDFSHTFGWRPAKLRYLLHAPPNGQVWHKAFFGGPGRRAGAHTRPAWPKIPPDSSAFPLLGAPQASGNKYNSHPTPKGVKAWEDDSLRPEEISSCRDTLDQIRAAASTAGRSATQQWEKRSVITAKLLQPGLIPLLLYQLCAATPCRMSLLFIT